MLCCAYKNAVLSIPLSEGINQSNAAVTSCRATLMPSSIMIGLGESPLWAATSTYLTISGGLYALEENKRSQDVINQYFGILYLLYQSSAVWGNLLSSLVFGQEPTTGDTCCKSCGQKFCLFFLLQKPQPQLQFLCNV